MANSLDQIFRNFINRITGGDDEETVAETRADQGGLMAPRVVRPRARPEDVEPVDGSATGVASTGNIALKRFVDGLNEATKLDVSLRPRARPLENTLIDANLSADKLQLKHNMPLYKFQQENEAGSEDGSTVKISPAPTSDAAIDEIAAQATSLFEKITRPRARPKSVEEIQAIRASQEYTDLDTTRGLQAALNNAGITVNGKPLVEDGIMGPLTKKAIRAFQKDKGLKVDGIAGPITKRALYGVAPQPEITEEELPPIKEETLSVPLSEGLMSRPGIRKLDPLKGTIKGIEDYSKEELKNLEQAEDVKVASIIGSIPVPEAIKKPLKDVNMVFKAVFSPVGRNFINDMMFGGGLASQANPLTDIPILSRQRVAGAEVFSEDALNLMRQMVLDKGIIDKGSVSIGKEVYGKGGLSVKQTGGASAKEIVKALAEGSDPINEIKLMLGQFTAKIDDNGDIIVTDQFNYNEIINPIDGKEYTPEQYEQAIKEGKFTEAEVLMNILKPLKDGELNYEMVRALGFVLGSRSYKDEDRRQGRLFEINLGPAVTRPRARPDN